MGMKPIVKIFPAMLEIKIVTKESYFSGRGKTLCYHVQTAEEISNLTSPSRQLSCEHCHTLFGFLMIFSTAKTSDAEVMQKTFDGDQRGHESLPVRSVAVKF